MLAMAYALRGLRSLARRRCVAGEDRSDPEAGMPKVAIARFVSKGREKDAAIEFSERTFSLHFVK
jgi:hypothetical protein